MAKRYREVELKTAYPNFEEMLVKLLNEHGQSYAAVKFGVSQATISLIVKRSPRIKRVCRYELTKEGEVVASPNT